MNEPLVSYVFWFSVDGCIAIAIATPAIVMGKEEKLFVSLDLLFQSFCDTLYGFFFLFFFFSAPYCCLLRAASSV